MYPGQMPPNVVMGFPGNYPMAFNGGFPDPGYRGRGMGRGRAMYPGPVYPQFGFPHPHAMAFRPRRKKPFHGGTLETQRQWEQANLCCFFILGECKFGENCRFSHNDDGKRPCQFGDQCRHGHNKRGEATPAPAQ